MTIRRVLIANRGEIATRIAGTLNELGVETVAVAATDDLSGLHVDGADTVVRLDGPGAAAYLDADALIEAARSTDCDAVHPGYGFLSESAEFAAECEAAGLTFIGPRPDTLSTFGDKAAARRHAAAAAAPVLRATDGATNLEGAVEFLESLPPGSGVMLKALHGGGGRGMRVITSVDQLRDEFPRAASEATKAFGDGDLFVEQLLLDARHIEVQIVGDGTGDVSHLWDRDCSIQRNRQKIIELAPAEGLDPDSRRQLLTDAVTIGAKAQLRGLATVEFLVKGSAFYFLEVNPRIQVEHTITEQITGVDLVAVQVGIAEGRTLAELGLTQEQVAEPSGSAVQLRLNAETLLSSGTVAAAVGTVDELVLPSGRGIRVDTWIRPGTPIGTAFDTLAAKIIVWSGRGLVSTVAKARRALAGTVVGGVDTNRELLLAILDHDALPRHPSTTFVEQHAAELIAADAAPRVHAEAPADPNQSTVCSEMPGTILSVEAGPGTGVDAGTVVVVVESMKMEHAVTARVSGLLAEVHVEVGRSVTAGAPLFSMIPDGRIDASGEAADELDLDHISPQLAQVLDRRHRTTDEHRAAAAAKRHAAGRRTARENIADLCDPGTFHEMGALTIAAQRSRRSVAELVESTPADGLVTGFGEVDGHRVTVISYDYSVLAGTQGIHSHEKLDRFVRIAIDETLPVVIFATGGGGRPGDTDFAGMVGLDQPSFRYFGQLARAVPVISVVAGRCFAGNAVLAGCADVMIVTRDSSLGMGGPAMIEGGGLGRVHPDDVGPPDLLSRIGVIDVVVEDDAAAVGAAREALRHALGVRFPEWECEDQRILRHAIPENRVRAYDLDRLIGWMCDRDSVLELRADFGRSIKTVLARIEGRPVGVMANDNRFLGGAIDSESARKASYLLALCDKYGIPVVSLVDTPGFMVGPDSESEGAVRHMSQMFAAGANLRVPMYVLVLRKAYGLGAMAMAGGDMKQSIASVAWPTGEFGTMGFEGAVRLGFKRELEAIADDAERQARFDELLAEMYERGTALNVAGVFEIDDVIDPKDTRESIVATLSVSRRSVWNGAGYER
ncbi:acetyl-CoA carboxylase family protein [Pseudonocardia xishanensis]|uniref:acetyl-CoA carboxylase n=1 Tax=Pseudonocardia xishanensis TaxID=630995 RepID=A0ABP8RZH1_9PSEU